MSYKSRIPRIAIDLAARTEALERTVADRVVDAARERVPVLTGRLKDAIHAERGEGGVYVIAGNREVFYGNIVEHGGAHTPPHPFLIPAAEQMRAEVSSFGYAALKGL
jgi:HK97 gp10 family phage protein